MSERRKLELLSPVGSMESLIAAVENGADAVYLGGKDYSARQYASNFDREELKKAVEYCHIQGVRTYITINTLLKEEELKNILDYIIFLYCIGVDSLIIQDLGLLKVLQTILPDFPIQSSTQMTIHSLEGVKLLEKEGFYRVVLSRELSLNEIKFIVKNSKAEIKIFNHGALCICYSGQCLMSSMIGGRSGNRGRCAQPCRKIYSLVHFEGNKEKEKGYLLSPKDLNTINDLQQLMETGVHSFKIEGRMKRPEYVAIVTSIYRKAIDQWEQEVKDSINEEDLKDLEQIFNRGFTTAYLFSHPGSKMINKEKPNNKGTYLGKIVSIDKNNKRMSISLSNSLNKGDGIEVWTEGSSNPGMLIPYIGLKNKQVNKGERGQRVSVPLLNNVRIGDEVFKTSDASLLEKARKSYSKLFKRKQNIYGRISLKLGQPASLDVWDEHNNFVSIIGEKLIEKANNKPLSQSRVMEQLNKLGGTPFNLKEVKIDMDSDIIVPIKELNQIRRDAVEQLTSKILEINREINEVVIKEKFKNLWKPIESIGKKQPVLSAKVSDLNSLNVLVKTEIQEVVFGGDIQLDIELYKRALELARSYKKRIVFAFPRITRQDYITILSNQLDRIKELAPDGLLLSNLELVQLFRDIPIFKEGDFSLNVFNHLAIEKLHSMGLDSICISPELSLKEIQRVKAYTNIPLSLFIHGEIEMMVTEYCPIQCSKDRENCITCKNNSYGLRDEKGKIFPIITDDFGRTHLLNSKKLCLLEDFVEILNVGLDKYRLYFIRESHREMVELVSAYLEIMNNFKRGKDTRSDFIKNLISKFKDEGFTKGHYFRGVL